MAAARASVLLGHFRRTLPGALLWRSLTWAPRFHGRARRRELLLVWAVSFAAGLLLGLVAALDRTSFVAFNLVGLSVLIGLPVLAAMVRRMHDINRYGTALLVGLFPYVGWLIVLVMLMLRGADHDNVFGPNPRA